MSEFRNLAEILNFKRIVNLMPESALDFLRNEPCARKSERYIVKQELLRQHRNYSREVRQAYKSDKSAA